MAEFAGATREQYDQVIDKMGMTFGGPGGPGQLFHFVVMTDEGTRITDVWETREQFEDFAQTKIVLINFDRAYKGRAFVTGGTEIDHFMSAAKVDERGES